MKAIDTGFGVSGTRAMGMLYPEEQRLYYDPLSEKTLSGITKYYIKLMHFPKVLNFFTNYYEKKYPGVLGYQFCRYRYIDDVMKKSLEKKEIEVIVNLGVGMDCRAYYIPGIESVRFYEVDHPTVIKKKKARIKKVLGKIPDHITYIPVDFEKQSLDNELKKAGYNLSSKTLFIWEGVSGYLTKEANDNIFRYVSKAATGSKIAFSYTTKSFINGENQNQDSLKLLHKIMVKKYKIVIHGFDPANIGGYLSKYSLSIIEHIGAKEYKERYINSVNIGLDVCEVERMVLAEVK